MHAGFSFQVGGQLRQSRVGRLDDFVAQGRERLSRERGRIASGVRLRREAEAGAVLLDEAGDGAPPDLEEIGHLIQSVIVMLIRKRNSLSQVSRIGFHGL